MHIGVTAEIAVQRVYNFKSLNRVCAFYVTVSDDLVDDRKERNYTS